MHLQGCTFLKLTFLRKAPRFHVGRSVCDVHMRAELGATFPWLTFFSTCEFKIGGRTTYTTSTANILLFFFLFRMGVAAPGDRVPGDVPLPTLDPVPAAPFHASIQHRHLGLPLADLQDHAGSGEWGSMVGLLGFVLEGFFAEVAAMGTSDPSRKLFLGQSTAILQFRSFPS